MPDISQPAEGDALYCYGCRRVVPVLPGFTWAVAPHARLDRYPCGSSFWLSSEDNRVRIELIWNDDTWWDL